MRNPTARVNGMQPFLIFFLKTSGIKELKALWLNSMHSGGLLHQTQEEANYLPPNLKIYVYSYCCQHYHNIKISTDISTARNITVRDWKLGQRAETQKAFTFIKFNRKLMVSTLCLPLISLFLTVTTSGQTIPSEHPQERGSLHSLYFSYHNPNATQKELALTDLFRKLILQIM